MRLVVTDSMATDDAMTDLMATDLGAPDEAFADPSPPRSRRRRPGRFRPRRPWIVAAAVLAVGLALLVWSGLRWWDASRLVSAHQAALAAAKQTTVDFVTISASSVDGDLQRIAAGATGDFKDEFTRGLPQVRQAVVENKVESTGQVLRAGLVSGDLDSAVVLVAVDASVKNVGAPDGRLSHYRIQVDVALDPDTGRWLVSRLQFVG
jgi:Mce-associated membrane protein